METSNTDFYPHQFKPVLRFIESSIGRLLIADEVGLGKTIEAIYIWKELQAREDARRFLVVCPSMLREKWKDDLLNKFNITAEIVNAATLLEHLTGYVQRETPHTFVYIASLEGLRPPAEFEKESITSPQARLARLLDSNTATPESGVLDLVVIDEAHNLRNPSTANNRMGGLLRDAARHLLLLTATPIQIHSSNLYQLMRLLDPDNFFNESLFDDILTTNKPVVNALRHIWRNPPNIGPAKDFVDEALRSPYLKNHRTLKHVSELLDTSVALDLTARVNIGRMIESCSLLDQHMSRSRKRDVLENRVERSPQTLNVHFNELEGRLYELVSNRIKEQALHAQGVSVFTLIMRQRQMASCMVAALEAWRDKGFIEELLWEDFGISHPTGGEERNSDNDQDLFDLVSAAGLVNLSELEKNDSKFDELRDFFRKEFRKNPKEKFVLFAYFRGTLSYLQRRLEMEGIKTCLIMGNMGDAKWDVLDDFRSSTGPMVLLSSEVGSEGIDLQFCRFIVNYDLPWNPMKVEQRIGRLDRLGQKADRISIVNLVLDDTIDDRILMRLYDRIRVFEESIGDLEDILGEMTEQMIEDLLNPALTDEEREVRADDNTMAILNRRKHQDTLEQEAINLLAFSDYILDSIRDSRAKGRWLRPEELISLVREFLLSNYPGTSVDRHKELPFTYDIELTDSAQVDLRLFINQSQTSTPTRLHYSQGHVRCLFDPRKLAEAGRSVEIIEPTHPLVKWIRSSFEQDETRFHAASAIRLDRDKTNVERGLFAYAVHRWSFRGMRSDIRIVYQAASVKDGHLLSIDVSEGLVGTAALEGNSQPNAMNRVNDFGRVLKNVEHCEEELSRQFNEYMLNFEAENSSRCDLQEQSARKYFERRQKELRERIQKFEAEGNLRMIPPTQGLLRKVESELQYKLKLIEGKRSTDPSLTTLAAGFIVVED